MKKIKNNNLKENLKGKINFEVMKEFYEQTKEKKDLSTLIEFREGAEMFRV